MRCLAVIFSLLVPFSAAVAQMTHEETVVRTAYAKLSYAVELETAMRAVRRNPKITYAQLTQEVAKESLTFRLSDFSVGDVAALPQDHKYYEFFPDIRDGGNVVDIGIVTEQLTEEVNGVKTSTQMDVANPSWSHGPLMDLPDLTVAEALPIMNRESGLSVPLTRYCTYNVTVTFEGLSRTYRAAFYFGPQGQPDAGDMVVALGGGALSTLLVKPVYPQVLVETAKWGKNPTVRAFLEANQRNKATCIHGEACCDLSALQCGIYSADLKGGLQ